MKIITEIIGYLAATVGTVLMLPQVIKMIKTKHVKDISLLMTVVYLINCALWDVYGLLLSAIPLIVCNTIAFLIGIVQFYLRLVYAKK
jgi:MtN3 and saliva related transmembrane protein